MTIGYSAIGNCYSTQAEALSAYYTSQPHLNLYISPTHYFYRPALDAGVWKMQSWSSTSGSFTYIYTLPTNVVGSCTYESAAYDYAGAAALWSFAFVSVISLWYLSKNLGMIIDAVRRL